VKLKIINAISIHKALKNHQNICKGIRMMEVLLFWVHVHQSKG